MSVEQLAIDTKIPRASIDALEEDRFTALPGPVFVKGFFRCCARSLSLDAEVVMALLHEHERAQQQLRAATRRERQAPQLLGRAAAFHASHASQYPAPQYTASQAAASSASSSASSASSAISSPVTSSLMSGLAAPMMPRSPVPGAPVHAVLGDPALATGDAAPIGPLFDFRALRPLMARAGGVLQRSQLLTRLVALVRGASNSRLLMWIAVSLMIAVIVATAFVMAGGTAPSLPQS